MTGGVELYGRFKVLRPDGTRLWGAHFRTDEGEAYGVFDYDNSRWEGLVLKTWSAIHVDLCSAIKALEEPTRG